MIGKYQDLVDINIYADVHLIKNPILNIIHRPVFYLKHKILSPFGDRE
jgi:hypothetical protein